MEDFDVLNLEYLNKLKYQCFVWAEFFSVVDSISPKPISRTLHNPQSLVLCFSELEVAILYYSYPPESVRRSKATILKL